MKKVIASVVIILGVGITMLYLIYYAASTRDEMTFQLERQMLRNRFTSQIAWVRQIQEDYRYEAEITGLLKWYFTEVPKLYKKFDRELDLDKKLKERLAGNNKEEGNAALSGADSKKGSDETWKEAFELVKMHWKNLSEGHYKPLFSKPAESVRLDILNIEPANFGSDKGLRADFIMWGGYSEFHSAACDHMTMTIYTSEDEWKKAHPTPEELAAMKAEEEKKAKEKEKKGKKEEKKEEEKPEQKILGRAIEGPCNPVIPVRQPQFFVEDFPPEAFVSYFQLSESLLPNEAKFIDILFAMTFAGRGGGSKRFEIKLDKVPVQDNWKLPPGAEWKAQTKEVKAEE